MKVILAAIVLMFVTIACSSSEVVRALADSAPDTTVADSGIPEADATDEVDAPIIRCGVEQTPGDACGACLAEQCCSEQQNCADEPDCSAYAFCISACNNGDQPCLDACMLDHEYGFPAAGVLEACAAHNCNAACGYSTAEQCGPALGSPACQACTQQSCCDELYAMQSSYDQQALQRCKLACNVDDSSCLTDCNSLHEDGAVVGYLLLNCLSVACENDCVDVVESRAPCGFGAVALTPSTSSCVTCRENNCCDSIGSLSASEAYWRYFVCAYACDTQACKDQCSAKYLEGKAWLGAVRGCTAANCYDECGGAAKFGSRCGDIYYTVAACNDCGQEQCCDPFTAVGTSFEGWAAVSCDNLCSYDASCLSRCYVDYPNGHVLLDLARVCLNDACADSCGSTGWICGAAFNDDEACGTCVEANCCDVTHVCGLDFDCRRIELCRQLNACARDDTDCIDACKSANPDGAARFDAAFECRMTACVSACASY